MLLKILYSHFHGFANAGDGWSSGYLKNIIIDQGCKWGQPDCSGLERNQADNINSCLVRFPRCKNKRRMLLSGCKRLYKQAYLICKTSQNHASLLLCH